MQLALAGTPLGFALHRKCREDFGWAPAFGRSSYNTFDRVGTYDYAASVKPVLDVGRIASPFEVVCSVVQLVFVLVVDDSEAKRIRKKGDRHQSVDHQGLDAALGGKLDLSISRRSHIAAQNTRPDVSPLITKVDAAGTVRVNEAPYAANPAMSAGLVKSLILGDIAPLFSFLVWIVSNGWHYAKNLFYRCFNVKLAGGFFGSAISAQVNNQVTIVAGDAEHSRDQVSVDTMLAMARNSRNGANAVFIGNFVTVFKSGDGSPFFSRKVRPLEGDFRENVSHKPINAYSSRFSVDGESNTSLIGFEDAPVLDGASSSKIRNFVPQKIEVGDRSPSFFHDGSPFARIITSDTVKYMPFVEGSQVTISPTANLQEGVDLLEDSEVAANGGLPCRLR